MIRVPYLGAEAGTWKVGPSTFVALPEAGARLLSWTLGQGDGNPRAVLYPPVVADLAALPTAWGGNPILFPFGGRCFVDGEALHWRDPAGTVRAMPNHGIARQSRFELLTADAEGFAARLRPDAAAHESYPFAYDFTVGYRFFGDGLACTLTLANLDRVPLPWCAGHHFYFQVPWDPAARRQDHFVRVDSGHLLTLGPEGRLEPVAEFPDAAAIGGSAAGGISHVRLRSTTAALGRHGSPEGVEIRIDAPELDETLAFVAWTPAADAPFYCVEPWLGPPNATGNGWGVRWVPPGASAAFSVTVRAR